MSVDTYAPAVSREAVNAALLDCLKEVVGADTVELLGVGSQTKVFTELGISSIDMTRLVELVGGRYPVAERLIGWLADKSLRALARLTVGDIADFIRHALA
ncbi:MAG: hypothetical protein LBI33_10105 [Propionibacteriaceae bacterium]|jgi:aminoglycoside phosphotransferase (APT) family kinase protein|nr:hypothetical protein [Propionibacteriaceae bacterium]